MTDYAAQLDSRFANESPKSRLFDADAALVRLDGDEELLVMLVGVFQQDSVELFNQLLSGVERGDLRDIERAAHSLKGLASNFDADDAVQAALAVELCARNLQPAALAAPIETLRMRLDVLREALAQWEAAKRQ